MATELHDTYTAHDARRLLDALRIDLPRRDRVFAGDARPPVCAMSRYCCSAVGLEDIVARANADDPRCPCARAAGWHEEVVR